MIPLTTTTLPVGLVRDLEAALTRPGAGVLHLHVTSDRITVVDRRPRGGIDHRRARGPEIEGDVPPPCPNCSTAMSFDAQIARLRCPSCGYSGTVRAYRRILRVVEVALKARTLEESTCLS